MNRNPYGEPNPRAPVRLSDFGFLIGKWQGEGRTSGDYPGGAGTYQMTWVGRYILDGHAIADESRILDTEGELERIFISFRFYDDDRKRWVIEVLDVSASSMVTQAADGLGKVQADDHGVTVMTGGPGPVSRERYSNISEDHFTYSHDVSLDGGDTWLEAIDVIEVRRVE